MRCTAGRVSAGRRHAGPLRWPCSGRPIRRRAGRPAVIGWLRRAMVPTLKPWPDPEPRRAAPGRRPPAWPTSIPGSAQELCALDFTTPFQLLVATVLSAQTTDERVNLVTPAVFARYPTPGRSRPRRPGRAGDAHPLHRLLPVEGQEPDRAGAGARRALRRRGAAQPSRTWSPCRASAARPPTWSAASASGCPGCRSTPT